MRRNGEGATVLVRVDRIVQGSFKADLEFNHLSSVVRVPGKIVPTFVGRLRLLSTSPAVV